jgi:hypothetical protein
MHYDASSEVRLKRRSIRPIHIIVTCKITLAVAGIADSIASWWVGVKGIRAGCVGTVVTRNINTITIRIYAIRITTISFAVVIAIDLKRINCIDAVVTGIPYPIVISILLIGIVIPGAVITAIPCSVSIPIILGPLTYHNSTFRSPVPDLGTIVYAQSHLG